MRATNPSTRHPYPADRGIHELFEGQVAARPDAVAVVFEGEALSYGGLNDRANRLAQRLQTLGVAPGSLVAICMQRSADLVVALMAVLKAGGAGRAARSELSRRAARIHVARLPAEGGPGRPGFEGRLGGRAAEGSRGRDCSGRRQSSRGRVVAPTRNGRRARGRAPRAWEHALAYVIYTSGSTGTPKGVMVEHGPLVNRLPGCRRRLSWGRTTSSCRRRRLVSTSRFGNSSGPSLRALAWC